MRFSDLVDRVAEVRSRIDSAVVRGGHGQQVQIIAVTKTHGPDAVVAAFGAGIRAVGENKVQEALAKMDQVTVPVDWHLIGHLQRNKARHAGRFAMVHSLDSVRLAGALDEVGRSRGSPLPVLVQVNVSGEVTKGGYALGELRRDVATLASLGGLRISGVMTMAPFEASESVLRSTFGGARAARQILHDAGIATAGELSMGMSDDFEIAVEEGATLVRLGTILFGARA
jgi:pyridoxal phosphate enzyme (YggS family)